MVELACTRSLHHMEGALFPHLYMENLYIFLILKLDEIDKGLEEVVVDVLINYH
jgi:hypothetical protein